MLGAAETEILDLLTNELKHAHYLLKDFEPSQISALKEHVQINLEICDKEIEETLAHLQRLQETQKKRLEQLAVLDRATTSWMDLPPEILIRIFRHLVEKIHIPTQAGDSIWALSYVCSSWREITLGEPTLWDCIRISFTGTAGLDSTVESILNRSCRRRLNLTLFCDVQRGQAPEAAHLFPQILRLAMSRTSALSLEFSPTALAEFIQAMSQSEGIPFSHTTSLSIAANRYSMLQTSELAHKLPHVSEITLIADRDCVGSNMPDLFEYPWELYTSITLTRFLLTLRDAQRFMFSCHRLVALDLAIGFDEPFTTLLDLEIKLPTLEQLTVAIDVDSMAENAVVLFFTHLNIPRIEKLKLSPFLPMSYQCLELPQELWPHLYKLKKMRSLEIEKCRGVDTEGILNHFPSLQYLSICDEPGNEMRRPSIDALASGAVGANLSTLRCRMAEEDIEPFLAILKMQWMRASQATASCIQDASISVRSDNRDLFNPRVQNMREEIGVRYRAKFGPPVVQLRVEKWSVHADMG